jgi:hypothetical protein
VRRPRGFQAGGRLVEEDDPRVADERHREVEPAPHAARVRGDRLRGGLGQVEALEQLGRAAARRSPAEVVQIRDQDQVLLAGEQVVDRRELPGHPDRRADRVGLGSHVMAGDAHVAAVSGEQRGEDLDGGRLAGAVGAEQREDRALGDVQVDPFEDRLVAEGLAQSDCRQRRGCGLLVHALRVGH